MKTLAVVAVIAAFCIANGVADPEPEAEPGYHGGFIHRRPIRPIIYRPHYRKWKRSADPEPEALADAEPEAEASRYIYGGYNPIRYRPYGSHYRWRRSAEPEAEAEAEAEAEPGFIRRRYPHYGGYGIGYGRPYRKW